MFFKQSLPNEKSDFWGSSDPAFECLVDHKRTTAFLKTIKKEVNNNDIVIDAGAGTGILSFIAAKKAKKVFAIERDPHLCIFMEETIKQNKITNVEVINDDVLKVNLKTKFDILISEMVSTGLIDELQVPAIEHLRKFAQPNAKFIPNKISNFVDLVFANDSFYKFPMFCIRYEYAEYKKTKAISFANKQRILEIDFAKDKFEKKQNHSLKFEIKKSGKINGIRISTITNIGPRNMFDYSFAYAMPLILPIPTINVQKGQALHVQLNYVLSGGLGSLSYSIDY